MARDREVRQDGLEERVVKIRRCAAVVKGGRRFSFNALVVVGKRLAEVAKEKGIQKAAFDRGHYRYHGRVKALADAAREGGLQF